MSSSLRPVTGRDRSARSSCDGSGPCQRSRNPGSALRGSDGLTLSLTTVRALSSDSEKVEAMASSTGVATSESMRSALYVFRLVHTGL